MNQECDSDLLSSSYDFHISESVELSVDNFMFKQKTQLNPNEDLTSVCQQKLDPYVNYQTQKLKDTTLSLQEKEKILDDIIQSWNSCLIENYSLKQQIQTLNQKLQNNTMNGMSDLLDYSKIFHEPCYKLVEMIEQSTQTEYLDNEFSLQNQNQSQQSVSSLQNDFNQNIFQQELEEIQECFQCDEYQDLKRKTFSIDAQLMQFIQILVLYLVNYSQFKLNSVLIKELNKLEKRIRRGDSINFYTIELLQMLIEDNE